MQAFARIHPNLLNDIYLRNTSQDSYTIFSNIYGKCIDLIGLGNAALTLTIVFKIWFFYAAWLMARQLSNSYLAFFASASLIVTAGEYGAFGVFHYAEDWLTARSLAEALVITALACYFRGSRIISLLIACAAMLVHPLMALPGVLLIICLWLPFRLSVLGAGAGILLAWTISLGAMHFPSMSHGFEIMDASWLEVVRERSQFLFLQFWRASDWILNARPFLSLSVSAMVTGDARVRKFCAAAMLVGATGLAVALISSLIGPVSILLQGQAWRWVWLTVFASMLVMPPTVLAMSRSGITGLFCCLLMIFAWTFRNVGAIASLICIVFLWRMRNRLDYPAAKFLRDTTVLCGLGIMGRAIKVSWTVARRKLLIAIDTAGLPIAAALLVASLVSRLPRSLHDTNQAWSVAGNDDFSDWRRAIPPDANVFVVPAHNSAAFQWFTLERPSYLTVDQSSGVVFSRATAIEVRRRAQVLRPLMEPDWRISSNMTKNGRSRTYAIPVLTGDKLVKLCNDPELHFVVASQNIGFEPIPHTQSGNWNNWNLYDCNRVRHGPQT